jgi:nitrate/nitrite transporter NarK
MQRKKTPLWERILKLDRWKYFGLLLFALAVLWLIPAEQRNALIALLVGAGGGYFAGRTQPSSAKGRE